MVSCPVIMGAGLPSAFIIPYITDDNDLNYFFFCWNVVLNGPMPNGRSNNYKQ